MEWLEFILAVITLIAGGGWFVTYKAYKRKQMGEATQSEAEGWKSIQDVYQQTIDDLKQYTQDIRADRNHLKEDRDNLRKENNEIREKYLKMEEQILSLRKDLARMGRRLEILLPFTCGLAGCVKRKKVDIQEAELKDICDASPVKEEGNYNKEEKHGNG